MKDMLVFVRAGHKSLHREWCYDRKRVDVLVSAYVDDLIDDQVFKVAAGGYNKFSHFADLVDAGEIRLDDYRYFFLVDDDIDIQWPLEQLVDFATDHGLALTQPSLTWGSFHTFSFLLTNHFASYRKVGLVEVMCPMFDRASLAIVLPTFRVSKSTWGIDLAYCSMAKRHHIDCSVVDALAVSHCKVIDANKGAWYAKLRADGVDAAAELAALDEEFGQLDKTTISIAPRFWCGTLFAQAFERIKPRLRRELMRLNLVKPPRFKL